MIKWLGKKRFLRNLTPILAWFQDGVCIDHKDKDNLLKYFRAWVGELGKVDTTLKKEQHVIK